MPVTQGEMVYLCWASANLDPASFEHPLEVDLDRVENRHIAFAAGIHRCLGSHLARAELRASIDQLHRRIPEYWVTAGDGSGTSSRGCGRPSASRCRSRSA